MRATGLGRGWGGIQIKIERHSFEFFGFRVAGGVSHPTSYGVRFFQIFFGSERGVWGHPGLQGGLADW